MFTYTASYNIDFEHVYTPYKMYVCTIIYLLLTTNKFDKAITFIYRSERANNVTFFSLNWYFVTKWIVARKRIVS